MRKTAKEREIPLPEVSDRLTETELALGQSLAAAIAECEAAGMEAETVLRRYCDALIETVKKTNS
jgi:hypothetical protein